ncbi:hypothetical protein ASD83_04980 [Devosia sp. Root685]|nr:hypothetical protein ASD83_04980 [Devosia sp. Root685]
MACHDWSFFRTAYRLLELSTARLVSQVIHIVVQLVGFPGLDGSRGIASAGIGVYCGCSIRITAASDVF